MYCLEVVFEDGFVEKYRFVDEFQAEMAYHQLKIEFDCTIKEYREN